MAQSPSGMSPARTALSHHSLDDAELSLQKFTTRSGRSATLLPASALLGDSMPKEWSERDTRKDSTSSAQRGGKTQGKGKGQVSRQKTPPASPASKLLSSAAPPALASALSARALGTPSPPGKHAAKPAGGKLASRPPIDAVVPVAHASSPHQAIKASSAAFKDRSSVTLRDLTDTGLLSHGQQISCVHDGVLCLGTLQHDGRIQAQLGDGSSRLFNDCAEWILGLHPGAAFKQSSAWSRCFVGHRSLQLFREDYLTLAARKGREGREGREGRKGGSRAVKKKAGALAPKRALATVDDYVEQASFPTGKRDIAFVDRSGAWVSLLFETPAPGADFLLHKPLCRGCGALGLPSSVSGMPEFAHLSAVADSNAMVWCAQCCHPFHVFCTGMELDRPDSADSKNALGGTWRCWDCIVCEKCELADPEESLLVCDACGKGSHTGCCSPPLWAVPEGKWLCESCVKCVCCGATSPEGLETRDVPAGSSASTWMFDYTLCGHCGKLKERGNFCRLCNRVYEDDDMETPMICCETCGMWLHTECVGMDATTYDAFSTFPDLVFNCKTCLAETKGDSAAGSALAASFSADELWTIQLFGVAPSAPAAPFDGFDTQETLAPYSIIYAEMRKVLHATTKLKSAAIFMDEPSEEQCPTYYDVVRHPTWLSLMQERLARYVYNDSLEFMHDVKQMVVNAVLFFGRSSVEASAALSLWSNFWKIMNKRFDIPRVTSEDIIHLAAMERSGPSQTAASSLALVAPPAPDSETEMMQVDGLRKTAASVLCSPHTLSPPSLRSPPAVDLFSATRAEAGFGSMLARSSLVYSPVSESNSSSGSSAASDEQWESVPMQASRPAAPLVPSKLSTAVVLELSGLPPRAVCDATLRVSPSRPDRAGTDERVCCLCLQRGDSPGLDSGRLIFSQDALAWAHVNCAFWACELDAEAADVLVNLQAVLANAQRTKCASCVAKGATVTCSAPNCTSAFHFPCARQSCAFLSTKQVLCASHSSHAQSLGSTSVLSCFASSPGAASAPSAAPLRLSTFLLPHPLRFGGPTDKGFAREVTRVSQYATALATSTQAAERSLLEALDAKLSQHLLDAGSEISPSSVARAVAEVSRAAPADACSASPRPLPALLARSGSLGIVSFGFVSPATIEFSQRNILYPAGFCSLRVFLHPEKQGRLLYCSQIIESLQWKPDELSVGCLERRLIFRVTSEDGVVSEGDTPEDAWRPFLAKIATRHPGFTPRSYFGTHLFGLTSVFVLQRLENLPNSASCKRVSRREEDWPRYLFKYAKHAPSTLVSAANRSREGFVNRVDFCALSLGPVSPSGSARSEVYSKPIKRDRFHFLGGGGVKKGRLAQPPSASSSSASFNCIALSKAVPSSSSFSSWGGGGGGGGGGTFPSAASSTSQSSHGAQPHGQSSPAALAGDGLAPTAESLSSNAHLLPVAMQYRAMREDGSHIVVGRSKIHGCGLFATRPIEVGTLVIEYMGERIRSPVGDVREKYYDSHGIGCYMFRIDDDYIVDATMKGNGARFINHSCEPNCYSKIIVPDGQKRIGIFTLRALREGEELTYDYKMPIEESKIPCYCGAQTCRGTMN